MVRRRDDEHDDQSDRRHRMVASQLAARGISDERVLAAMRVVPRHEFVPAAVASAAYDDRPLPIGHDVTISQPYIVALMTQALHLEPDARVLEIGTGSGYAAAVLAEIAGEIVTIETIIELVEPARRHLAGYGDRVRVIQGDGSCGYPELAPYDAISVTAAAPTVPPPLVDQLADGGRLVIPVGRGVEDLVVLHRIGDVVERSVITQVRFVPLTGQHGA